MTKLKYIRGKLQVGASKFAQEIHNIWYYIPIRLNYHQKYFSLSLRQLKFPWEIVLIFLKVELEQKKRNPFALNVKAEHPLSAATINRKRVKAINIESLIMHERNPRITSKPISRTAVFSVYLESCQPILSDFSRRFICRDIFFPEWKCFAQRQVICRDKKITVNRVHVFFPFPRILRGVLGREMSSKLVWSVCSV